jgi:hypothetical protein
MNLDCINELDIYDFCNPLCNYNIIIIHSKLIELKKSILKIDVISNEPLELEHR